MKKILALVLLFALPHLSWAQVLFFHANLSGGQEAPPNASPGTGFADAVLDTSTNILSFTTTWSGLTTPTVDGHIHRAPVGVSGPIIIPFAGIPLGDTFGTYSNNFVLTAAQVTDLMAGLHYVNIHTTQFRPGEIRGQLLSVPEPSTYALSGAALLGLLAYRRFRQKRVT
jgi:hypothetical protein